MTHRGSSDRIGITSPRTPKVEGTSINIPATTAHHATERPSARVRSRAIPTRSRAIPLSM